MMDKVTVIYGAGGAIGSAVAPAFLTGRLMPYVMVIVSLSRLESDAAANSSPKPRRTCSTSAVA